MFDLSELSRTDDDARFDIEGSGAKWRLASKRFCVKTTKPVANVNHPKRSIPKIL